jgi:hypothetical protein
MTPKEVLDKAYGNLPKEVGFVFDMGFIPVWRGLKYYTYVVIRKFTRR